MDNKELRKLIREAMLKESKVIKEYFDDESYFDDEDDYEVNPFLDKDVPDMMASQDIAKKHMKSDSDFGGYYIEASEDEIKEIINSLKLAHLNLPSDAEIFQTAKKLLNRSLKKGDIDRIKQKMNKIGFGVNESEFEGPQPGDAEYHYEKPKVLKGIGAFKNIDWRLLHETLVANTEFHETGKVEGNPNYMEAGVNDLTDYDGLLSKEELNLLENRDLIEIVGHYPIISDKKYIDYNIFLHDAQLAWKKGFDNSQINQKNDSETPYMRGVESHDLIGEDNINPDSKIDRPKDAQGQPITLRTRVIDIPTKSVGHVLRFGVDDNGRQTVHVEWIQNFGGEVPKTVTYPDKIVVKDSARIVREEELGESSIRSHANSRSQNIKPGNYPVQLKRDALRENQEKDYVSIWWNDMHPFEHIEIFRKYFPEKHYSNITKDDVNSIFEKEMNTNENLENAIDVDDEMFFVIDNDFNRAHYADLIGKTFKDAPGYAQVKVVKKNAPSEIPKNSVEGEFHNAVEVQEDFDYSAEERDYYDKENLAAEKPANEDFDYASAERNYHDTEVHKETQNLIGKNIVIKNKDEMTNLIFKNFKRINSIYDGIKDEIESHRVFNDTIAATDNMDTTWIFDVVGVDDGNNNVYLKFTGTAK